jgi:hypothetical protein
MMDEMQIKEAASLFWKTGERLESRRGVDQQEKGQHGS